MGTRELIGSALATGLHSIDAVAFPSNETVAVGGEGGVRLVAVGLAAWQTAACRIAGRDLARDEWMELVGDEVPHVATCAAITRTD